MTQYYEYEARRLEHLASISSDPAEQSRLWALASQVGTVVEWCPSGDHELWPKGAEFSEDCDWFCKDG